MIILLKKKMLQNSRIKSCIWSSNPLITEGKSLRKMCFMLFIVLPQSFYDALKDVPKIVGCGKEKNGCGANLYSGEMLFDEARHYIRRFG